MGGPAGLRIRGPLPLAAEASAGEVVVGGGRRVRLRWQVGLDVYGDGGAVVAEHRPTSPTLGFPRAGGAPMAPAHGLEVDDPAVGALLLEVQEPVLAGRGAHPAALVRTVDVGVPLLQDDLLLVRAEEPARAEDALPAGLHSPCGSEDPEPAVVPVELGAFEGEPAGDPVAVDDHLALVEEFTAVEVHAMAGEAVLPPRTGLGPGAHQIGLAGRLVPQGARVDQALARLHEVRTGPGAPDLRGVDLEDALVRVAPEDPEPFVVVAQRGCPDPAVVPGLGELPRRFKAFEGVADERPVDQV